GRTPCRAYPTSDSMAQRPSALREHPAQRRLEAGDCSIPRPVAALANNVDPGDPDIADRWARCREYPSVEDGVTLSAIERRVRIVEHQKISPVAYGNRADRAP